MVLGTDTFQTVYSKLNTQQKLAVDTIDGPVMVLAGPGTGKTQVLAARIANILSKTDERPQNILALTFTDSAAKNMRERVVQMIGKTGYYVTITTFHAFCKDIIESHPEYFSLQRDSQALTQIERFEIFQGIIKNSTFEALKPINAPFFYLRDIIKNISDLKKEGVSPSDFEGIIAEEVDDFESEQETLNKTERARREKLIAKHQELLAIYTEYQETLRQTNKYDFDDMIAFVADAFRDNEELLMDYQENLHYFLVDEYQDTNTAQNSIVDMLALGGYWGESANIFVVGDPNQSIYRFQGASVENMFGFAQKYPQATIISLETGYRSTQVLYDAAHALIQNNALTDSVHAIPEFSQLVSISSQKLTSIKGAGKAIRLYTASSDVAEVLSVGDQIDMLIKQGVPPEEIAVLYRNNADGAQMQEVLEQKNIRYEIAGGVNVLETETIRSLLDLFALILAIRGGNDPERLFEIFSYEWMGLNRLAVLELARYSGTRRLTMTDVLEKGFDAYKENCETCLLTQQDWESLQTKLETIKNWGITDLNVIFSNWFTSVIEESGFLAWIKSQPNDLELLLQLNTLFSEIKAQLELNRDLKLASFMNNIAVMHEYGISLPTQDLHITEGAVRLATAHSAKGQEWQYVFLIKSNDGKWGNSKKRDILPLPDGILKNTDLSKKERNEDDRRLFYVAITRAKEFLQISYPKMSVSNGSNKEILGSMFIEEIRPYTKDVTTELTESISDTAADHIAQLLTQKNVVIHHETEAAFYRSLVDSFVFSVTALNDYLRDPQQFLYTHLLRVPRARSEAQAYGTAVHAALEQLYKQWCMQGGTVDLESVLQTFERSLQQEILHIDDYERRLRLGKRNLQLYCEQLGQQKPDVLMLEKTLGKGIHKVYIEDIPITGRIDRVDWLDKARNEVRVIDYKTGKPKTINEIEARTQSAQADLSERERQLPESIKGAYKRQLLFYKLLTDTAPDFKQKVVQGVFDFVEPDKQTGKFTQRSFDLSEDAVEELKLLLIEVAKEVRSLSFLEYKSD